MKAELKVVQAVTQVSVICPHCEEGVHRVEHLFAEAPRKFGPWWCDSCGGQYEGTINSADDIDLSPLYGDRRIPTIDLLELLYGDRTLFLVVQSHRQEGDTEPELKRFYYETSACPSEWISDSLFVIDGGEPDPHGFAKFVKSIDMPDGWDHIDSDEKWMELFPEALDGETLAQMREQSEAAWRIVNKKTQN